MYYQNSPFCSKGVSFAIQPYDTIFQLSKQFHIPVDDILNFNPTVDPDDLRVGQQICIPINPCPTSQFYTLKQDDTIYKLGKKFGISVDSIIRANPGIDPDTLSIGHKVCIPRQLNVDCPMNQYYIIKPGDTLSNLAERFNVTVDSIVSHLNPHIVNPDKIPVGMKICVPNPMEVE